MLVGGRLVARVARKKLENKVSVKVTTRRCTSIRVTLVGYTFSKLVIARIVKLLLFSLNRFDGYFAFILLERRVSLMRQKLDEKMY